MQIDFGNVFGQVVPMLDNSAWTRRDQTNRNMGRSYLEVRLSIEALEIEA